MTTAQLKGSRNYRNRRQSYRALWPSERVEFLRSHKGFLLHVQKTLAQEGVYVTDATICRTWNKVFSARPNPAIVAAIEREYQLVRAGSIALDGAAA